MVDGKHEIAVVRCVILGPRNGRSGTTSSARSMGSPSTINGLPAPSTSTAAFCAKDARAYPMVTSPPGSRPAHCLERNSSAPERGSLVALRHVRTLWALSPTNDQLPTVTTKVASYVVQPGPAPTPMPPLAKPSQYRSTTMPITPRTITIGPTTHRNIHEQVQG